jgi:hypothetical protein
MVANALIRAPLPRWRITRKAWLCLCVILGLILAAPHGITIPTHGDLDHLRTFQPVTHSGDSTAVLSGVECSIHFGCSVPVVLAGHALAVPFGRSLKVHGGASAKVRLLSYLPYHPPRLLLRA